MKKIESHICFGGTLDVFEHQSEALGCAMKFSIFLPPQAKNEKVPLLSFLSGLTCTHENFTTKAGAYGYAAEHGIAILAPDTSPRGDHIADDEAYDFGQGAGFYINATQDPWAKHFQMERYITQELQDILCNEFPIDIKKQGVTGHSMGGHGAISLGLKYPDIYQSISAFSPIVAPSQVPWGQKAFRGYLGDDESQWQQHDSCAIMRGSSDRRAMPDILIDQGLADDFLEMQLQPYLFADACAEVGQKLILRLHDGYDHSYYFIQSFIADHIAHHAAILKP